MARFLPLLLALAACNADAPSRDADAAKGWHWSDGTPDKLADGMVYDFAALPMAGAAATTPWAASYWPMYQDSIDYRWAGAGTASPAEKFETAYDRPGLADRISGEYGIDSQSFGTECTADSQCGSGEACAIRDDASAGYCIETWMGICHAWAPASIMEPEPKYPVEQNGVTFEVNDIKALVTLSYDAGFRQNEMALRCNYGLGEEWGITFDAYGRPKESECADTNAGAFHGAITNLVGIRSESLVEDRTFDTQVWNQPIRDYTITRNDSVSASQAGALVGDTGATAYRFNSNAVAFRHVEMTLRYVAESSASTDGPLASQINSYTKSDHYAYIVELDAAGTVVGGEWIGDSKTTHPDFLTLPVKKEAYDLLPGDDGAAGLTWADVKDLLDRSQIAPPSDETGGFDWGDDVCAGGDGAFGQFIEEKAVVEVGTLIGAELDIRIDLASDEDVDIQLKDVETGTELIAWPDGMLNDAGQECAEFEGVSFCYSGYNGDGGLGREWITVTNNSGRELWMGAYGYTAGDADVTYRWTGLDTCVDSGSGSFQQDIVEDDVVVVGDIPAGKTDIRIELTSAADVDVQLFDGSNALVQWPDGMMNGAGRQELNWEGVTITWSGYNGGGTQSTLGHEYITIEGTLSKTLTMKAFGYKAGFATVDYAWGVGDL